MTGYDLYDRGESMRLTGRLAVWSAGVAVAWLLGAGSASAQHVSGSCNREGTQVVCDIRTDYLKAQVQDVVATINGKSVERTYESFDRAPRKTTYYVLVQQSTHPKNVAQIVELLASRPGQGRNFGVATFTDKFEEHLAIGATRSDIDKFKDRGPSQKADAPSALYVAANEAMNKLTGFRSDRRALVIFSDGRVTNLDTRDKDKLLKTAREQNVLIYSVFVGTGAKGSEINVMQALRSESNGVFIEWPCAETSCKALNTDVRSPNVKTLIEEFLLYMERGGILRIATTVPRGAEIPVEVKFTDGTTLRENLKVVDGCAVSSCPQNGPFDAALEWLSQNVIIASAGGVAALGLLVLGVALMRRRGTNGMGEEDMSGTMRPGGTVAMSTQEVGHTQIIGPAVENPPQQVYAWLQFLDAEARRIPIGSTNVRIGRGRDNEIILSNKTVHRQHAVIKRSSEGRFSIHDLGGANTVKVNNQPTYQQDLIDNDMIELGEVRMRFFSNASA